MSGEEIAVLEEKMKDNLFIKLQENFSSCLHITRSPKN